MANTPTMKLDRYLARKKQSPVEFAKRIGLHFTTVYDYLRKDGDPRRKRPRADTLEKIMRETGGDVGAADFYGRPSRAAHRT